MTKEEFPENSTANAKIQFDSRPEAEEFARQYTIKTFRGHSISAVRPDGTCEVDVYDMNEEELEWVSEYVRQRNKDKEESE